MACDVWCTVYGVQGKTYPVSRSSVKEFADEWRFLSGIKRNRKPRIVHVATGSGKTAQPVLADNMYSMSTGMSSSASAAKRVCPFVRGCCG